MRVSRPPSQPPQLITASLAHLLNLGPTEVKVPWACFFVYLPTAAGLQPHTHQATFYSFHKDQLLQKACSDPISPSLPSTPHPPSMGVSIPRNHQYPKESPLVKGNDTVFFPNNFTKGAWGWGWGRWGSILVVGITALLNKLSNRRSLTSQGWVNLKGHLDHHASWSRNALQILASEKKTPAMKNLLPSKSVNTIDVCYSLFKGHRVVTEWINTWQRKE